MFQPSIQQYQDSTYCQTLFSELFILQDIQLSTQLVLKKAKNNNSRLLTNQFHILQKLQNKEGFPALKKCQLDESGEVRSISIQKLNSSLKTLITNSNASNLNLPLNFIINIGLQMLDRVQTLHQAGYIHMDLKPEHFLFQNNDPSSILYLIDFGLSISIGQKQERSSHQARRRQYFRGNISYSSLRRMKCLQQSIRDDLESVLYIIGEMIEGQLPWKQKHCGRQEKMGWKGLFSRVLSKKMKNSGWKKCGIWIKETVDKIRTGQDPYYQFRSSICKLSDIDL